MSDWDQFGEMYDQPYFEGEPRTYLIASTPRSGSHYLGHLLFETGELGSPLEYFHPGHLTTWKRMCGASDLEGLLRSLFRRRTSATGWFGVKAHWPQLAPYIDNEVLMRLVNFRKYIRITRRDRLAQAISLVLAKQTKAWISFHLTGQEPRYDFAAIRAAISEIEAQDAQWERYFGMHDVDPILIEYETLIADPSGTVDVIRSTFGLKEPRKSVNVRLRPDRQSTQLNLDWKQRYFSDLAAAVGTL